MDREKLFSDIRRFFRMPVTTTVLESEISTRTVDFDPEYIRRKDIIDQWSDWIFTRNGIPSNLDNPDETARFNASKQALREMTRRIVEDAVTIKHVQKAIPWHDEGAGVEAVADDRLIIGYNDGSEGRIHWNAGSLGGVFPYAPLEASGKIRDILEEHFPEVQLDGPIIKISQVFHELPESYSSI